MASGDPTCAGINWWTLRVLVTGAGGFVGGHLRPALELRGHEVVSLFSPRRATSEQLAVDLTDPEAVVRALADARPDAVVHLAARARPAGLESIQTLLDNNVRAAHNVLEAVRSVAPRARAIIVSSSAVYGAVPRKRNPVVEEEPLRPLLPYGASKAAVEALTSVYAAHGLDVVTVRPFNLLGPGQGAEFVTGRFAQQIVEIAAGRAEPVIETGALEPVRDFIQHNDIRPEGSDSRHPPIYSTVAKDHHIGLGGKPRRERTVTVGKILRMPWFLHDEIALFGIEQVVACQGDFVNHCCPIRLGAAHIPPAIPKGIVGFCHPGPPGLRAYCLFHRYTPLPEKPKPAY